MFTVSEFENLVAKMDAAFGETRLDLATTMQALQSLGDSMSLAENHEWEDLEVFLRRDLV
jgi:hypothetical protein